MWFFDGEAWPGWHDYLGLAIAIAGFWIAIYQIRASRKQIIESRKATDKATAALATAQKHLTERSLMAVVPQFQSVSTDLTYALASQNVELAHRTLVRFSLIAREASGILVGLNGDHAALADRLIASAAEATTAKGKMMTAAKPNVSAIVKAVAVDIETIGHDLTGLSSTLRNTLEGSSNVQ